MYMEGERQGSFHNVARFGGVFSFKKKKKFGYNKASEAFRGWTVRKITCNRQVMMNLWHSIPSGTPSE